MDAVVGAKSACLSEVGKMRSFLCVLIWAGLICTSVSAGTVQYQVELLDSQTNEFRLTYSLHNFVFFSNQELDLQFDPSMFEGLSNSVGPVGFDILLLQPNSPPGTSGDLSALALVNNPDLASGFSVDVTMTGSNRPGVQRFAINQLDEHGVIVSTILRGDTAPVVATPEPATFLLAAIALLVWGLLFAVGRRFARPD
jgi:hypothetical protein